LEKFDVIVVGGGLAGLAAAYKLVKDGTTVLVLERGDYCGAKNVTGGRIYLNPIRSLLPEIWEEAPLERPVTQEKITMMTDKTAVTIKLNSEQFRQKPYHSYTILRGKVDRWLSEKVEAAGGMIVTKTRVDNLIVENGVVKGIVAGEDSIGADVVIAADGVMSLMAEKAGFKKPPEPGDFAVGIKEIIELPEETIANRFNLQNGEGAAHLFMGAITKGLFGGGFLYTNRNSISLGMVMGIKDLTERQPPLELPQLIEEFKLQPEISALITGGEMIEYAAHVIPEAGYNAIPPLFGDGFLIAGDAAGLALSTGITVRGMEFAIASGVMAAEAVKYARAKNDFTKNSLVKYQELLKNSFVLRDLDTFRHAPHFLSNPRLFTLYPETFCGLMEKMMYIGDTPKQKLSSTAFREIRSKLGLGALKDIVGVFRL
jgi:electron transfer flavoprotein-quinone oxidoreductase